MCYRVSVRLGKTGLRVQDGEIEIGIKSEPERGRANKELVQKLAKHFGVPAQNVGSSLSIPQGKR